MNMPTAPTTDCTKVCTVRTCYMGVSSPYGDLDMTYHDCLLDFEDGKLLSGFLLHVLLKAFCLLAFGET